MANSKVGQAVLFFFMLLPIGVAADGTQERNGDPEVRPLEEEFRMLHPQLTKKAVSDAKFKAIILICFMFLAFVMLFIGMILYLRHDSGSSTPTTPLKRGKNFRAWKPKEIPPPDRFDFWE